MVGMITAIGCRITHCDRLNQNPPLTVRRRQRTAVDAASQHGEQRGQEGQGYQHREEYDGDTAYAEGAHHHQVEEQQPGKRDNGRARREHYRLTEVSIVVVTAMRLCCPAQWIALRQAQDERHCPCAEVLP